MSLGFYTNEMQRSINGLGSNYRRQEQTIIPYGHFSPYRPGAIAQGISGGFGDVPNDFEASVDLQYIPVRQGWYSGFPVDGSGYPDSPAGFGETAPTNGTAKAAKYMLIMQAISTVSIATIAGLAIAKAVIEIRRKRF